MPAAESVRQAPQEVDVVGALPATPTIEPAAVQPGRIGDYEALSVCEAAEPGMRRHTRRRPATAVQHDDERIRAARAGAWLVQQVLARNAADIDRPHLRGCCCRREGECHSERCANDLILHYMPTIAELRREYARSRLDEGDLAPDPFGMFAIWFAQAVETAVPEPNAMALATVGANGAPSVRIVLLKAVDSRGFVFFTDFRSRKGTELAANPMAALVFYWHELERQVRVVGSASRIPEAESDAYYHTRPLGSRFGAWASEQSTVLSSRAVLEARLAAVEARHPGGDVPRPPHWGGFRISPVEVEFWQGRESRLHDRLRYRRDTLEAPWRVERLSP